MPIIKVPTVNDSYTGHVSQCTPVAGKFGEQVSFMFANGDQLFLPITSAKVQLLRLKFDRGGDPPEVDYGKVPGNTLAFTRTPNKTPGAAPYWNIDIASAADLRPQTPSKRLAGPTTVPGEAPAASDPKRAVAGLSGTLPTQRNIAPVLYRTTKEDVAAAYEWAFGESEKVQQRFVAPGALDVDAVQAGAATLLIALQKEGLVAGFSRVTLADVKQALDLEVPDGPYPGDLDEIPF